MLKGCLQSSNFSPSVTHPALPRPHPLLAGLSSLADLTVVGGKQRNKKRRKRNTEAHLCLNPCWLLFTQLGSYSSDRSGDGDD